MTPNCANEPIKDEPITLYLTDFYFHRTVCQQKKNIQRDLMVSQYFRSVVKMGRKPGATLVIVK